MKSIKEKRMKSIIVALLLGLSSVVVAEEVIVRSVVNLPEGEKAEYFALAELLAGDIYTNGIGVVDIHTNFFWDAEASNMVETVVHTTNYIPYLVQENQRNKFKRQSAVALNRYWARQIVKYRQAQVSTETGITVGDSE